MVRIGEDEKWPQNCVKTVVTEIGCKNKIANSGFNGSPAAGIW